jgi:hypothetical protein
MHIPNYQTLLNLDTLPCVDPKVLVDFYKVEALSGAYKAQDVVLCEQV